MKNIFVFLFFLGFSLLCFGQFEKKNTGKIEFRNLPSDNQNTKLSEKDFEKALQEKFQKQRKKQLKNQKKDHLKYKGILTAKMRYEKNFKNPFSESGNSYAKIDQDFGFFSTKENGITILCRDHGAPDGDVVTVYLNNLPIIRELTLENHFRQFSVPLKKGVNTIYFKALNQGSSGPNTAHFMIFNKSEKVIANNLWNLATGAKATLTIIRE